MTKPKIAVYILCLILSLPLLSGCFGGSAWNKYEEMYGAEISERYILGTPRPEVITSYGNPNSTFVWTDEGWPPTMDPYVRNAIRKLEQTPEVYVYRVDIFQKFWSQHRQNQGNFGRYEDLVFYDEYDDVIGGHRRNI